MDAQFITSFKNENTIIQKKIKLEEMWFIQGFEISKNRFEVLEPTHTY